VAAADGVGEFDPFEQALAGGDRSRPAARRPGREVGVAGQGDAERLPVQAPVEEAEAAGVDVDEEPLVLQRGRSNGTRSTAEPARPARAAARSARPSAEL
jgi:hypothetical protein